MIISCPECEKKYQLDDTLFKGQPQSVRCASCGHVWSQEPDPITALENNVHIRGLRDVTQDPFAQSRTGLYWGWGTLILFLGLITCVLMMRNVVAEMWPQTAPIFRNLGLSLHNPYEGIAITNTQTKQNDKGLWYVEGDMVNTAGEVRHTPKLRVGFVGKDVKSCSHSLKGGDCLVAQWMVDVGDAFLFPGEQLHFKSEPQAQPPQASSMLVEF